MKTKKKNALLILAMMMGLLFAMSTVVFANDDPVPFDDTQYLPTESGTYSLENDVDLREQYVVPAGENITIDLNGKEVIDSDGGDCMIYIGDHDNTVATSLTIKDSAGEGKIFGEDRYNYMVWVTGKGTFTLESGTIQTDSRTLFRVQHDARIVINSGKVSTNTESSVVDLYDNSSLTVNGGEVFGSIQTPGNPSVSVSGGLFEMRPKDEWIADGYTVIEDQGDDYYYYKVVKGVSSITLDEWEPYVAEGEDKTFHATVLPEDAYNKDVIWSSDNEAVATVTQEGVVSGKAFGDVTITAKPAGQPGKNANSYELTATSNLTVTPKWKKIIAIPTGKTVTYNGESQTGIDAGTGFTLSGTTSATNAGSYQATATLEEGYIWNDGTSEPKTISWTINKAISEVTAPTGKTLTYNGKSQTGVAAGADYTLTGTAKATNAGSYTSTATLNTTTNYAYIWADGSTSAKTIKWKINKAAQSITKVTPASKTYKAVKKTKKLGKTYKFTLKAKGKGSGKVTFKKANKAGASKITVSKAGKVTIKKGLKKGTYKVKVKASKAANTNYTAAAKTVIVKIIVK